MWSPFLSEAGGQTDRVGKAQPMTSTGHAGTGFATTTGEAGTGQQGNATHANAVSILGVECEEEFADQG